jgi:hypothetical protein
MFLFNQNVISYDSETQTLPYNFFLVDKINKCEISNEELLSFLNKNFFSYLPLIHRKVSDEKRKLIFENLSFSRELFVCVTKNEDNSYNKILNYRGKYVKGFYDKKILFGIIHNLYGPDTEKTRCINDIEEDIISSLKKISGWSVEKIIDYIFEHNKNVKYNIFQLFLFVRLFINYNYITRMYVLERFWKFYSEFDKKFPYETQGEITYLLLSLLVVDEEKEFLKAMKNNMFCYSYFREDRISSSAFFSYDLFFSMDGYFEVRQYFYKIKEYVKNISEEHFINKHMKSERYLLLFSYEKQVPIITNAATGRNAFKKMINNSYKFANTKTAQYMNNLRHSYSQFSFDDFNNIFKRNNSEEILDELLLNALKMYKPIFTNMDMERKFLQKLNSKRVTYKQVENVINNYEFYSEKNYKYCLDILNKKGEKR